MAEGLVVQPIAGLLAVRDAREPVRVLIASLAPGGAERIVLEWLADEAARGRAVELAVMHRRRTALLPGPNVPVRTRAAETVEEFLLALAHDWRSSPAPVSTHLVGDDHLRLLWEQGVRTVPVVHNSSAGWRNDPSTWERRHVPRAVACARAVRAEVLASGCGVPVMALRHRPRVGPAAIDPAQRRALREEQGIGEGTFLLGAIGAIKPQKDHARAIEVLAHLARRRDAVLVILGGMLDPAAVGELNHLLEAAIRLGVDERLRLPGFVADIEPWLAACDALVNVSRFEGLSIAVQEALAAGLPVVATDVGGQAEIGHAALELVPSDASAGEVAARLARHPVRTRLEARPFSRAPRAWSLTLADRECEGAALDTLFVTANLNAGGAQRSLVNLAGAIGARHRVAVAVCGDTTHAAFAGELSARGVEAFRVTALRDDFAIAESLLAHAASRRARALCLWNVAPGVKLLLTRFAPERLRLIDVSPGRYAFEELEGARAFAEALDHSPEEHYARLDVLVVKHADAAPPRARRVEHIPNGVAVRAQRATLPPAPRYLVSGRIAPSKRLEAIIAAFCTVRRHLPAAELHVLGVAEPRHADYAASLERAPGVIFRGAGFDLAHLDEPWTAAVVLGIHQGCPNAVLEAMAAAIPVIANASGGTSEVLGGGEAGWLLSEEAESDELARAMLDVHADPVEASARGLTAMRRARERHSIDAMAERYLRLLGEPERMPAHEKMPSWSSATARAAPLPLPTAPLPVMPGS